MSIDIEEFEVRTNKVQLIFPWECIRRGADFQAFLEDCVALEESEALAQLDYESRVADLFRESGEEQCSSST